MALTLLRFSLPPKSSIISSVKPPSSAPRLRTIACKARGSEDEGNAALGAETLETVAAVGGVAMAPVIATSLYALYKTGCGLPPGPGGVLGAVEGVSYLALAGILGWSIYTKVKTGKGLPGGPFGLLGAVEGVSYLLAVAIVVVFALQFFQRGYIPGPLPGDQCFG